MAYRGTEVRPKGDALYQLDAADFTGPLDRQVMSACHFVKKNMRVAASKQEGRRDRPQFDLTAVFEAVVNAVAHRDYAIYGAKIRLRLFADRFELYSHQSKPKRLNAPKVLSILFSSLERADATAAMPPPLVWSSSSLMKSASRCNEAWFSLTAFS